MFKLYINSYYDMLLYYIIISVILFILVLHGYNKIKYKFWINQPIFYRYNIANWFCLNSILSFENPKERLHLNFLSNNVSYITDTYIDKQVGNIYMNEIDKSIKYYEDIILLINNYPYFNKKYNNGNMKFLDITRRLDKDELKILLQNHDYNSVVTINTKNIYKSDNDSSNVISVINVVGVIISIPLYCFFKYKSKKVVGNHNYENTERGKKDTRALPIYFSNIYYNSQEIGEDNVTEMIESYTYKIRHDWDEVIRKEMDFIEYEKHEVRQVREINGKSEDINNKSKLGKDSKSAKDGEYGEYGEYGKNVNNKKYYNPYKENGLKIVRTKEKIYTSIFKYTGINIPKLIVPLVEYHSFYIPVKNWNNKEYVFHSSISLIKIGVNNINIFLNYMQSYHTNDNMTNGKYSVIFDVTILPSFSHMYQLIKSEIYKIYILLQKNNAGISGANNESVMAIYMFRKSNKSIMNKNTNNTNNAKNSIIDKKDMNNITYMPISVQMPNIHDNYFICGFINALKMEKGVGKGSGNIGDIGCVAIDTLSHNKKIIDYFLVNNKPLLVEKNTLLFHNYICKTVLPENVMIIN